MSQPAPNNVTPIQPPIPKFEEHIVEATTIKVTGMTAPDTGGRDLVIGVDDMVRLVGEFKVVRVNHFVDKDGKLIREQVLKPITVETCPWDPADPNDDGVVRAKNLQVP